MYQKIKERTHQILQITTKDTPSTAFSVFIITLIILNVIAVIMGTVEGFARDNEALLLRFEIFSVVVFTIEYALRIWSASSAKSLRKASGERLRFAGTPLAIVDLLAILPFYLPPLNMVDLRIIRALRLFRLFRLFHIRRFSEPTRLFARVLKDKRDELLIALGAILILSLFSSVLVYFAENQAQPQAFASIPDSIYWAIVTMTTVGYGDVYPITAMGKFLASIISILGLGLLALPTAILSSGMLAESGKKKGSRKSVCPHCGKDYTAPPEKPSPPA